MKNNKREKELLVVGLGASAGGLGPLKQFFQSLPDKTGMAFIVVVHLSPDRKSSLVEILQKSSSLNILQVKNRSRLKPDHVYVIPPDKLISVNGSHLVLSEPGKKHGIASVDLLFRSLGKAKGKHAACVILSGSGTDGSVGIKTVKEYGGLTISQNPEEAEYSDMPENAIATGLVDKILPVKDIAGELLQLIEILPKIEVPGDDQEDNLEEIFSKIHEQTGHDFSNYKRSSILRRISRRMHVNRVTKLTEYISHLKEHPEEVKELFKDLLISVTNFFRDPDAFNTLEYDIIPELFKKKKFDNHIRIWTVGCATGEEAYSIAILLHEYLQKRNVKPQVKIFATDIDEEAIKLGREGIFTESIASDISDERLNRYFTKEGYYYQLNQEIMDMVLFTPHDLLRDPPFLKLDMVVCRNLLIYLNRELQAEVFKLFHYALNNNGWMFLGMSGSNLDTSELFTTVNKDFRIFRKNPMSTPHLYLPDRPLRLNKSQLSPSRFRTLFSEKKTDLKYLHQSLLIKKFAPQSVILNESHEVIHSTDGVQKYLEYSGGEPSKNILDMVKPELRKALRNLLFQVKENKAPGFMKSTGSLDEGKRKVELQLHNIHHSDFPEGLVHVIFKEAKPKREPFKSKKRVDEEIPDEYSETIDTLERELEFTREKLLVSVNETEASNEKLRAYNEELQSMNEELHSTTEELETSLEELQSVNEELKISNQELQNKVDMLSRANNDLKNLMESIEIALVFIDRNFCLQRYTSKTEEIFNLIPSDIGRPFEHITHHLNYDSLKKDVALVLKTHINIKRTISAKDDDWYIMRLRPYRSTDGVIEGVVLTFLDITELREAREELKRQKQNEALATLGFNALVYYDLEKIIQTGLEQLSEIMEADYTLLYICDLDDNTMHLRAFTGLSIENKDIDIIQDSRKWDMVFARYADEPLIVQNYREEDRAGILPMLKEYPITSGLHIKVMGSEDIYGMLSLYTKEQRDFTKYELHYVQVVASIFGLSVERIEAKKSLEKTNKQLKKEVEKSRQYQREILNTSMAERWEIGGYLHDNIGQLLVSTKIVLSDIVRKLPEDKAAQKDDVKEHIKAIDDGINSIRDLTHDIIPVNIEEEGVDHAFRFLIRQSQKVHNLTCKIESIEVFDKIRDRKLATNLYHIIQEAIRNAATHGKAKNITISSEETDGHIVVQIKDDGSGLENFSKDKLGKGLRIMKHRIELSDGTFSIGNRSEPGQTGVVVKVTVPLEGV